MGCYISDGELEDDSLVEIEMGWGEVEIEGCFKQHELSLEEDNGSRCAVVERCCVIGFTLVE